MKLTTTDIFQQDPQLCEDDFYAKDFSFSYSSMNLLLWQPVAFYTKYILKAQEEDNNAKHLLNGKVIHALLLSTPTEDLFSQNFVISPNKLPSDNTKKAIDYVFRNHYMEITDPDATHVFKLRDFSISLLNYLKETNLHQALKTDEKRLEKLINPESESYWDFLMNSNGKDMIDQSIYEYCLNAVDTIKETPGIMDLLGMDPSTIGHKAIINEQLFDAPLKGYSFGIKGIIDNLVIDHQKKMIYINDIKTTSKGLDGFSRSIDEYRYWLQAIVYVSLVMHNYLDLIKKGYAIKFHFVVIDQNLNTYAFPVSQQTLTQWLKDTREIFKRVDYHYTERKYLLPYEYDLNLAIL